MNVTYACPVCHNPTRADLDDGHATVVTCLHCRGQIAVPAGAIEQGRVQRCVVCPSSELYVRKDFSQFWGVAIVVVGFVASSIAWYAYHIIATYAILFGTAALDMALYLFTGNLLQCYRCQAQYRGVAGLDDHQPFHLETHEKHRQQLARLAEAEREATQAKSGANS